MEEFYIFLGIFFVIYWGSIAFGVIGAMFGYGHESVRKQKQPVRVRMK
jgi:hypothetical protein